MTFCNRFLCRGVEFICSSNRCACVNALAYHVPVRVVSPTKIDCSEQKCAYKNENSSTMGKGARVGCFEGAIRKRCLLNRKREEKINGIFLES